MVEAIAQGHSGHRPTSCASLVCRTQFAILVVQEEVLPFRRGFDAVKLQASFWGPGCAPGTRGDAQTWKIPSLPQDYAVRGGASCARDIVKVFENVSDYTGLRILGGGNDHCW